MRSLNILSFWLPLKMGAFLQLPLIVSLGQLLLPLTCNEDCVWDILAQPI